MTPPSYLLPGMCQVLVFEFGSKWWVFFNNILFLLFHSQSKFYTDLTDAFLETPNSFKKPAIQILKTSPSCKQLKADLILGSSELL